MGIADWLRRFFSPSVTSPEDDATLRAEYGTLDESDAAAERPEVPSAVPASGGIAPEARPGAPAAAEVEGSEIEGEEPPREPAA